MSNLSLLSSQNRVVTPFIKVTIGDYVFGVYEESRSKTGSTPTSNVLRLKYPNYIKSLDITKINGQVNQYTLKIEYVVTEYNDPNFFDKVFSSVSSSRKIVFSYGDLSTPYYCYRDEEGIITDVKTNVSISGSKLTYTVSATSSTKLASSSSRNFCTRKRTKPSDVIRDLLKDESFGLLDLFYGMRNGLSLNGVDLIPSNDLEVNLEAKENMSPLDYLRYLVNEMTPMNTDSLVKGNIYLLKLSDDVSNELNGPYFQIVQSSTNVDTSDAYEIDIGTMSKDIVTDFSIEDDETYSIYYDYAQKLEDTSYVRRYNNKGDLVEEYAPTLGSKNAKHRAEESDKSWWTKVTAYPIKASITIKGLLRPATLVSNVRINTIFYGKKHSSSGLYLVTKQEDSISESGFTTKLNLVRVSGDNQYF